MKEKGDLNIFISNAYVVLYMAISSAEGLVHEMDSSGIAGALVGQVIPSFIYFSDLVLIDTTINYPIIDVRFILLPLSDNNSNLVILSQTLGWIVTCLHLRIKYLFFITRKLLYYVTTSFPYFSVY